MAQHQISIIGAGISGLVLGRCLLNRGIRTVLYERDAARPRHGYGIILRSSAYRSLLPILGIDEDIFRHKIAVDGPVGGQGRENSQDANEVHFRANRAKFEELLREGLDVKWEHSLTDVKVFENQLSLEFENGQKIETKAVIGAEGVHSPLRKKFCPNTELRILPFAVYNGKRRLDATTFDQKYAPYMKNVNSLTHRTSDTLLQISVDERSDDKASISYTYSRPARQSTDPLFRPKRSIPGATDIPSEFFSEIDTLTNLEQPFKEVFNSAAMKDDRLLNWLMRSVLVSELDLGIACEKGVILIGDSCRHTPILASDGANQAIEDAVNLAKNIRWNGDELTIDGFYKQEFRNWIQQSEDGEARLAEMHRKSRATL